MHVCGSPPACPELGDLLMPFIIPHKDPHLRSSSLTTPLLLGHPRFPSRLGPCCGEALEVRWGNPCVDIGMVFAYEDTSVPPPVTSHQPGRLQFGDSSRLKAADGCLLGPWAAHLFCPQECKAFPLWALLPCSKGTTWRQCYCCFLSSNETECLQPTWVGNLPSDHDTEELVCQKPAW